MENNNGESSTSAAATTTTSDNAVDGLVCTMKENQSFLNFVCNTTFILGIRKY